jgi:hypothetical protein
MRILKDPNVRNYILVYHLYESRLASSLAKRMAKEKGLSIIEIHAGFRINMNKKKHKQNLDPLELIGFIYFANIILTSSFHGMALSLILNKNFYVINKGYNTRQKNLLETLKIKNRLIDSLYIDTMDSIDYLKVQKILSHHVNHAKLFLMENIS